MITLGSTEWVGKKESPLHLTYECLLVLDGDGPHLEIVACDDEGGRHELQLPVHPLFVLPMWAELQQGEEVTRGVVEAMFLYFLPRAYRLSESVEDVIAEAIEQGGIECPGCANCEPEIYGQRDDTHGPN